MAGNTSSGQMVITNTLVANNADFCFLTGPGFSVKVTNITGNAPIYFTVDKPGGPCQTPTVGGPNCYAVASVAGANTNARQDFLYGGIIQLISTGTPTYMVEVQSLRATS